MKMFLSSEKSQFSKLEKSSNKEIIIKYCTNCGHQLESDDIFCDECGSKIEQVESVIIAETEEKNIEEHPLSISSDRRTSILQTNKIKSGEIEEEQRKTAISAMSIVTETKDVKAKKELEEKAKLLGYYVYKDSYMTQYLVIEEIQENTAKAFVKTTFSIGGYSTEFYEGTIFDDEIHLHLVDSDLHPPTGGMQFFMNTPKVLNYTIQVSENFDGRIDDKEIAGLFTGHFTKSLIFKKC